MWQIPFQVEKLLENYMQEVGISEQQFLHACSSPLTKSKSMQVRENPLTLKGCILYTKLYTDICIIYLSVCVCV